MIDRLARWTVAASGVAWLIVGVVAFAMPATAASQFPWNVSPFVAMTIGGWAIGAGLIALHSAWEWDLPRRYAALVFFWVFCALELLVVVAFLHALRTDHSLSWPYLAALGLGVGSAVAAIPALRRAWPAIRTGPGVPRWIRFFTWSFIGVVGFLAVSLFLRDANVEGRTLFPEPLTLFTVRAFAAFFAALVASAVALLPSRDPSVSVELARMGLYLVVPITIAALLNLAVFDFAARPGGLIYIGLYLLTLVLAVWSILWDRRRRADRSGQAD